MFFVWIAIWEYLWKFHQILNDLDAGTYTSWTYFYSKCFSHHVNYVKHLPYTFMCVTDYLDVKELIMVIIVHSF